MWLKLLKAQNLLAETDAKLSDIAGQCGFHDEHTFSRYFHQLTGLTPAQ